VAASLLQLTGWKGKFNRQSNTPQVDLFFFENAESARPGGFDVFRLTIQKELDLSGHGFSDRIHPTPRRFLPISFGHPGKSVIDLLRISV
jgi:hypothetical protein